MPKVGNETYLFCQLVQNQAQSKRLEWSALVAAGDDASYNDARIDGLVAVLNIMQQIRADMERR